MDNRSFIAALEEASGGAVLLGEPMSAHTTFRVGGPADFFATPSTMEALCRTVEACRVHERPFHVLGCGSNVLVADSGVRGVVVKVGSSISDVTVEGDGAVHAEAGAANAKIARAALKAGLAGFEFAAGIPGSIGGAAIMNAGAYDGELRDVATGVTCLTCAGELVSLTAEQADWGYRRSMMGDEGYLVLSVDLQLTPGDPAAIRGRMEDLARRRSEKQPLDMPSAGSTFKRPEGHYAGKLIQDAGMQGYSVGGAQVSRKHAGFVVNARSASASDVRRVIEDVQSQVFERFGVRLEPEVRMWGFEEPLA